MPKVCRLDGCEKPTRGGNETLCAMHYHRWYRNGTFETVREKATRHQRDDGYVYIGPEREHRIVYREHYGESLPDCWGCGIPLSWDMGKRMHIDHINENKADNRIENLRASCCPCNVRRGSQPNTTLLTALGLTQPLNTWAKSPLVMVCAATIRRRKKRGMNDHNALFSPKVTHKHSDTVVISYE